MFGPLRMAALLLSVHPLPDQGLLHLHPVHTTDLPALFHLHPMHTTDLPALLHLHPMHKTDLPAYLPQVPAGDCSYQRGGEVHALRWFPW